MEVSQLLSESSSEGREPSPPRFTIDVYADTTCPWCYLGKRHLQHAIDLYRERSPDAEFNVSWKPFILSPHIMAKEWSKRSPFLARLGPKAPAFFDKLEAMGSANGIHFKWEGTTGNSRDSHKLILLAMDQDAAAAQAAAQHSHPTSTPPSSPGTSSFSGPYDSNYRQNATTSALYRGGFEHGQDISDRRFLVEVALRLGLAQDAPAVHAWLDSTEAEARLDAHLARAKAIDINGVPSYVVQGRFRVGGMQEPEVFLGLFDRIRARELGQAEDVTIGEMEKGPMVMRRPSLK